MKSLLSCCAFLFLVHFSLGGQDFNSSHLFNSLPNNVFHTNGVSIDEFGDITATSDGGYAMVGSFIHQNLRYGIVIKLTASHSIEWWYCYGNGDNPSDVYFRDVIQAGQKLYIVGDVVVDGIRYPYIQETDVNQSQSEPTFTGSLLMSSLPRATGVSIEKTFNDSRLVIAGSQEFLLGPLNQGYFHQIQITPNLAGEGEAVRLPNGTAIFKIVRSEFGEYFYLFGTKYDPIGFPCEGNVLVARLNDVLEFSWGGLYRTIGGVAYDRFIDGIASDDGGFTILGETPCTDVNGDIGPNNVCFDTGIYRPYWIYKGNVDGEFEWTKSLYSEDPQNETAPFGLLNYCSGDQYLIGYITNRFMDNDLLDLYTIGPNAAQSSKASTGLLGFEGPGIKGILSIDNKIIFGASICVPDDPCQYVFSSYIFENENNCCLTPEYLGSCLDNLAPPCPYACSCINNDPELPLPFQCETFDTYDTGPISPQSTAWLAIGEGGNVALIGEDQALHLVADNPLQNVVYKLTDEVENNLGCGRYRLSWELTVPENSSALYMILNDHMTPIDNSSISASVFFGEDGSGLIWADTQSTNFTFLAGFPNRIMHIIDLDQETPKLEFWLNGSFITSLNLTVDQLGGIQFLAPGSFGNFWVDNICIRTPEVSTCSDAGTPVCIQNGSRYDNSCAAKKQGLYTEEEFQVCYSICDLNAGLIGRSVNVQYSATLEAADQAPPLVLSESCVADAYGGQVPSDLYADIFLFENTEQKAIDFRPEFSGQDLKAFIFRCTGDDNIFTQECLGEYDTLGDTILPTGFYHILVTGTEETDYKFEVFPNSVCNAEGNTVLSCAEPSHTGTFPTDFPQSQMQVGEDFRYYQKCYGGIRTYAGEEQAFRLSITESSLVDITFSTTTGKGGLFLFNTSCETEAVNYLEIPDGGGTETLPALRLTPNEYILVVDQELDAPIGEFSININCTLDLDNQGLGQVFVGQTGTLEDCELSDTVIDTVRLNFQDPKEFSGGKDIFSFNDSLTSFVSHPSLVRQYNEEDLVFYIQQSIGASSCSFSPGDSMQLYVRKIRNYQSEYKRIRSKLYDISGAATFGRFEGGRFLYMNSFPEGEGPQYISMFTSYAFPSTATNYEADWNGSTRNDLEVLISQDWITTQSLSSPPTLGPINIIVSENNTFSRRTGSIEVNTTDSPRMSQTIQIVQQGRCETPILQAEQPPPICQGESIVLKLNEVGPGPDSIYSYKWSTGETTAAITISPSSSSSPDYFVTVTQGPSSFCTANSIFNFKVEVNPPIPEPTLSNTDLVFCEGDALPSLTVNVDPDQYRVNWYDSQEQPIAEDGTTFQPQIPGIYYAETEDLITGCRSSKLPIEVIQKPSIQLSTSPSAQSPVSACIQEVLEFTAQSQNGQELIYKWSINGNTLSTNATLSFLVEDVGETEIQLYVETEDQVCTEIRNFTIVATEKPEISLAEEPICSDNLESYSLLLSTTNATDVSTELVGVQVIDLGDGQYQLVNIPVAQSIDITALNSFLDVTCSTLLTVSPPQNCNCGATTIPTPTPQGSTDIVICEGQPFPSLQVLVDGDQYTVNWYDSEGEQVASNQISFSPDIPGTYFAEAQSQINACTSERLAFSLTQSPALNLQTAPSSIGDIIECVGDTIQFQANVIGDEATYQWSFDGVPQSNEPSYKFPLESEGNSTVNLLVTSTDGLCVEERIFNIIAIEQPGIQLGSDYSCSDDFTTYSLTINTTNTTELSFQPLDVEVNNIGDGQYHFENIPIAESLSIIASNTFGGANCMTPLVVNPPENCSCGAVNIPMPSAEVTDFSYCDGEEIPPLSVTLNTSEYLVNWYNEEGTLLASDSTSYQPLAPGTYFAEAQSRENSCTSGQLMFMVSQAMSINLETIPVDPTSIIVCTNEVTSLAVESPGQGFSYEWLDGDSVISEQWFVQYKVTSPGTSTIQLTVSDEEGLCFKKVDFEINAIPKPTIIPTGEPFQCSEDEQTFSATFITTFADTLVINHPQASYESLGEGIIRINNLPVDQADTITAYGILNDSLLCYSFQTIPPIDCSTIVDNPIITKPEQQVKLYPNPTSGIILVEFLKPLEGRVEFTIFDVLARKQLISEQSSLQQRTIPMDLSTLAPGTYWLQIRNGGYGSFHKIVKTQ